MCNDRYAVRRAKLEEGVTVFVATLQARETGPKTLQAALLLTGWLVSIQHALRIVLPNKRGTL